LLQVRQASFLCGFTDRLTLLGAGSSDTKTFLFSTSADEAGLTNKTLCLGETLLGSSSFNTLALFGAS
jgi:hypothetical protein